jgi:hypothetical protein
MDKITVPYGTDEDQDGVVYLGTQLVNFPKYIGVIPPGQTLVAGNHQNGGMGIFPGPAAEEIAPYLSGAGKNIVHGFLNPGKKGLRILQYPAALTELRGGDKIHGLGNLQRLPDGPHPQADIP